MDVLNYEKVLSIVMAMAMLVSCFAISTGGYCNYIEYTENYKQIVGTTVKNAVYTGKKLEPAVRIETADGKKYYSAWTKAKTTTVKK